MAGEICEPASAPAADMPAYEAFLRAVAGAARAAAVSPAPVLQLFVDTCAGLGVARAGDLDDERRSVWAALPSPRFRCVMLVDTSCEDPCDWATIVASAARLRWVAMVTVWCSFSYVLLYTNGLEKPTTLHHFMWQLKNSLISKIANHYNKSRKLLSSRLL
jgi:hypothetical protein